MFKPISKMNDEEKDALLKGIGDSLNQIVHRSNDFIICILEKEEGNAFGSCTTSSIEEIYVPDIMSSVAARMKMNLIERN